MKIKLKKGIQLYYKKIGQGDPLLLLHGNGDSHEGLEVLGNELSKDFTVYLIDSRGHGKSSNPDEYFVYEDLAEDMDCFISQLNLKNVSIIGHSDGAITAALLAIQNKSYLSQIILLGITLKPEQMKSKWTKWIQDEYDKNQHPLFKLMINEPQIELDDLTRIQIPAFVVAAEDDVMDTERYVEIAEAIPHGELYIVANEEHSSYVIDTNQFAEQAVAFIKENSL